MSVKVMAYVWETPYKGSEKLTLLAIADHCDNEGQAFPGVDKIAAKVGVKPRQCQRIMEKLEAAGELVIALNDGVNTQTGATNRYYLKGYRDTIGLETPVIGTRAKQLSAGHEGVSSAPSLGASSTPSLDGEGVSSAPPPGVSPTPSLGVSSTPPKPSVEPSVEPSVIPASDDADTGRPEESEPETDQSDLADDTPPAWESLTPGEQHTRMKNAIVAAFGWDPDTVTVWGEINNASKKLRDVGVQPEAVKAIHDWLAAKDWTTFGPMSLAKHYPEYAKQATGDTDDLPPSHQLWQPPEDGDRGPYFEQTNKITQDLAALFGGDA